MNTKYLNLLFSLVVVVFGFFCIEIGDVLVLMELPADYDLPAVKEVDKTLNNTVTIVNESINKAGAILKTSGMTLTGIGTVYAISFCGMVIYRKGK